MSNFTDVSENLCQIRESTKKYTKPFGFFHLTSDNFGNLIPTPELMYIDSRICWKDMKRDVDKVSNEHTTINNVIERTSREMYKDTEISTRHNSSTERITYISNRADRRKGKMNWK